MILHEQGIEKSITILQETDSLFREVEGTDNLLSELQNISVEVVTDVKVFNLLRKDWESLTSFSKYPYLQFEWFEACAKSLPSHYQLNTIVLKRRGKICAIAPLTVTAGIFGKKLEMLGSSLLFEPAGFVYADSQSLQLLLDYIFAQRLPFLSGRLHPVSLENEYLKKRKGRFPYLQFYKSIPAPWILIQNTWLEFEHHISSSRKSAVRRAQKKADEHGVVIYEVCLPTQRQVQTYMQEFIEIENAGWKSKAGTSIKANMYLKQFFTTYACSMASKGKLRMCFMRINGQAVAAQMAVEHANCLWILKVGYDELYSHCSPGILLMHHVIQYAFEHQLTAFEFLGGDEEWIRMWTEAKHDHNFYWFYPVTPNGILCFIHDSGKIIWKKFFHHFSKKK